MVVHALQQVTHQLGVEERHRQLQQLDEKIGHQGDVYSHADMQQYPPPNKINGGTANS